MARDTIARLIKSRGYLYILHDNEYEFLSLRSETRGTVYDSPSDTALRLCRQSKELALLSEKRRIGHKAK